MNGTNASACNVRSMYAYVVCLLNKRDDNCPSVSCKFNVNAIDRAMTTTTTFQRPKRRWKKPWFKCFTMTCRVRNTEMLSVELLLVSSYMKIHV